MHGDGFDQTIVSQNIFQQMPKKNDVILISAAMFLLECCSGLSFVMKTFSTKTVQKCPNGINPKLFQIYISKKYLLSLIMTTMVFLIRNHNLVLEQLFPLLNFFKNNFQNHYNRIILNKKVTLKNSWGKFSV